MKYILLLILFIYSLRLHSISGKQYEASQIIGFSLLFTASMAAVIYIALVFLSSLPNNIRGLRLNLIYFIVGTICLSVISLYDFNQILNDTALALLFALFILLFSVSGESITKSLPIRQKFSEIELKKIFLNYPPIHFYDFLFFYIYLAILMLLPIIIKSYWAGIMP